MIAYSCYCAKHKKPPSAILSHQLTVHLCFPYGNPAIDGFFLELIACSSVNGCAVIRSY